MILLSVHEALDRIAEFDGRVVCIVGRLSLDFEDQCIDHIPAVEHREGGAYQSSIWVFFDHQRIDLPADQLRQFDRRHVVIEGRLSAPDPQFGGCGHFSLWPAEILVTAMIKA